MGLRDGLSETSIHVPNGGESVVAERGPGPHLLPVFYLDALNVLYLFGKEKESKYSLDPSLPRST